MDDLASLRLPVPPLSIQRDVAVALQARLDQIGSTRDAVHASVGLLTERREALISAAVTGQIDIPAA